jgi:hypothetical protein
MTSNTVLSFVFMLFATGYQPEAGRGALYPNEVASDFAFIPFGGGARKCVGDQFALFEATVALAMLLRRFTFRLAVPAEQVRGLCWLYPYDMHGAALPFLLDMNALCDESSCQLRSSEGWHVF